MRPPDSFSAAVQTPLAAAAATRSRLIAIDALRGLVIVIMLLDHVRETFFLHRQVGDPMDVTTTAPELFWSRLLAHVCAPVFVLLTGLSAWLYGSRQPDPRQAAAAFLFKRGLILVLLEVTLVNFAWTFQFPPTKVFLQVIWAIGISMVALSALVWLPRRWLAVLGLAIVAGHNLLDGWHFAPGHALHVPWAILHDRGWLEVSESLRLRTSYPVLPWIGVISLGYVLGPWFAPQADAGQRQRRLVITGLGMLLGFVLLRSWNGYGDTPWQADLDGMTAVMSFVNITKYPPSLLFLMLTLGLGLLVLAAMFRQSDAWLVRRLAVFGAAPMFFYLLHLYVLKLLYLVAEAIWGRNQGDYFGFDPVWQVWLCTLVLAVVLYWPVRWFAGVKARRRDITWLKYF